MTSHGNTTTDVRVERRNTSPATRRVALTTMRLALFAAVATAAAPLTATMAHDGSEPPAAPVAAPERAEAPPPKPRHEALAALMPRLKEAVRSRVARAIVAETELTGVDPLLVLALIHTESCFDPHAVSSAGAVGLMQLKETTMRAELARSGLPSSDPRDPVASVRAGVRYLRRLIDEFGGVDVALMAYNAGPNRILGHQRRGKIPERFHAYPRKVKHEMERLKRAFGVSAPDGIVLTADH